MYVDLCACISVHLCVHIGIAVLSDPVESTQESSWSYE